MFLFEALAVLNSKIRDLIVGRGLLVMLVRRLVGKHLNQANSRRTLRYQNLCV